MGKEAAGMPPPLRELYFIEREALEAEGYFRVPAGEEDLDAPAGEQGGAGDWRPALRASARRPLI